MNLPQRSATGVVLRHFARNNRAPMDISSLDRMFVEMGGAAGRGLR